MITEDLREELVGLMGGRIRPDKWGKNTVQSLYYDTPSYLLIRRSLEHPLYKEKFRLRCYGLVTDSSKIFAEIKKKYNSVVYKRRIVLSNNQNKQFMQNGPLKGENVTEKEIEFFFKRYDNLSPKMLIQCEREAYFDKTDKGLRITFDRNILYRNYDLALDKGFYGIPILPKDAVLMEIKAECALPMWLCQILSEKKLYKQSFSKYGRAFIDTLHKMGENKNG